MRNFKNTKAYEVIAHRVNTKDRTDCYFVEALSKRQLLSIDGVLKVYLRKDLNPAQCEHELFELYPGMFSIHPKVKIDE